MTDESSEPEPVAPAADPSWAWVAPESGSERVASRRERELAAGEQTPVVPVDRGPVRAERPPPEHLPVPLRPMTVSDMLDGAFAILRTRPRAVFTITIAIMVPVQVISAFLQKSALAGLKLNTVFDSTSATASSQPASSTFGAFAGYFAQAIQSLGFYFLGGALACLVSAWYAGTDMSAWAALKASLRKGAVFFVVWLVLLPLYVVTCYVGAIFVVAFFVLAAPAIVIEDLGPFAGIKRAASLALRRYWWVLLVTLLATIVELTAFYFLNFAITLWAAQLPEPWNWTLLGSVQSLLALVTAPALAGTAVLLYLDLRVRTEGLDLVLDADEVFGRAAAAPSGAGG